MAVDKVTIRNEADGSEARVLASTTAVWEAAGWTVVEDESKETPQAAAPQQQPQRQAPPRKPETGNVQE